MHPPGFWRRGGRQWPARLLAPLGVVTAKATAWRLGRQGWQAPVPVICCGNLTVGGAGKTTLALDLGQRLLDRGVAVHFLTRGYGGRTRGPLLVQPGCHDAAVVGDEPLLLGALAPCWVAADRAAGARAAIAAGAQAIIMDDGLQNPGLRQDLPLLVIDGATGFGNGRVLPAGPLREPVAAGAARCGAAVLIGPDEAGALAALAPSLPLLRARLAPGPEAAALRGRRVLAFAGIARPGKFFATLREAGAQLVGGTPFADHHRFGEAELRRLLQQAAALDAVPVTTPKDAVRLSPALRDAVRVVGVSLAWRDEAALEAMLRQVVP